MLLGSPSRRPVGAASRRVRRERLGCGVSTLIAGWVAVVSLVGTVALSTGLASEEVAGFSTGLASEEATTGFSIAG